MSFPEAVHLTGESASALSTKRCMEAGQSSSDCFHQDFAPGLKRKRSVSGPAGQAAWGMVTTGDQFQGSSSARRLAGWSAMRVSTSRR